MRIIWDEAKRLSNLDKHGMDFAALDGDFFLWSVILSAKKSRLKAIAFLDGMTVAVIFTRLGAEAISIISMRPASQKERMHYG